MAFSFSNWVYDSKQGYIRTSSNLVFRIRGPFALLRSTLGLTNWRDGRARTQNLARVPTAGSSSTNWSLGKETACRGGGNWQRFRCRKRTGRQGRGWYIRILLNMMISRLASSVACCYVEACPMVARRVHVGIGFLASVPTDWLPSLATIVFAVSSLLGLVMIGISWKRMYIYSIWV